MDQKIFKSEELILGAYFWTGQEENEFDMSFKYVKIQLFIGLL